MHDWSVKEPFTPSNWITRVRGKIRASDLVIVICGEHTNTARGVDIELRIAQDEKKPYFMLAGYSDRTCYRPPQHGLLTKCIGGPGITLRTLFVVGDERSEPNAKWTFEPGS